MVKLENSICKNVYDDFLRHVKNRVYFKIVKFTCLFIFLVLQSHYR